MQIKDQRSRQKSIQENRKELGKKVCKKSRKELGKKVLKKTTKELVNEICKKSKEVGKCACKEIS